MGNRSSVEITERRVLQSKIAKFTNGVLGSLTDFVLFNLFFLGEYTSSFDRRAIDQSLRAAHEELYDINYQKIKATLYSLRRKGLIKSLKLAVYEEIIADKGRRRIASQIPRYQGRRLWDKRVYLITYDIPEKSKRRRDILRVFLKKIGCAFLQGSVWLSIYNPKTLVKEFAKENNIPGQILISDLGPDGSIGEENLKDLVTRVYHLEEINEDYEEFLCKFRHYKELENKEKRKAIFHYLSILKNDPQLPFPLLPSNWKGERAYLLYRKIAEFSVGERRKILS